MKAAPSVKAAPSALDFDANSLALQPGVQLLEASAGTGKTFALAHLVLRLVSRELDPLDLERLLVVTFTDAAAAELRDRIARRLQQALAAVEGNGPTRCWRTGWRCSPGNQSKGCVYREGCCWPLKV